MSAATTPPLPAVIAGDGPPLLLLHGFALTPATYRDAIAALARDRRVVAPSLFRHRRRWRYDGVLATLVDLLDQHGIDTTDVVGHSFGGGVALGLAARYPDRVRRLVFVDSHGLAPSWRMARDAFWRPRFVRMATAQTVADFFGSVGRRPVTVAQAGWWAFSVNKDDEIARLRASGIPRHVVFGADDSLIPVARGRRWAGELGASFRAVRIGDRPTDHEWPVKHPEEFARVVDEVLR